jgi:predicted acetyltransferase
MGAMDHAPIGYRTVPVASSRRADVLDVDTWAFPSALSPAELEALPLPLSWDRTVGVEDETGALVAVHSSYPFGRFPVPGARIPVAGLTWVGVHPQHRRHGILTGMIRHHLAASHERGEAISALFAAEMPIYGRFGYGLAARNTRMTIPRGAALRDVPGTDEVRLRVEHLDASRHGDLVAGIHDAASDRPGWATRETTALRETFLSDPVHARDGAESQRIVVAEVAGQPRGYALFRRKDRWEPEGPRGVVRVRELVALDAAVARELWRVLLDLDLTAVVETPMLASDDVVHHLLVDLRAAAPRLSDNVWVRIVDLPAALESRRYAAPVDVVLEVTDALVPQNAGRWRVRTGQPAQTGSFAAQVTRTDDDADLRLDIRELGAAYLGGASLSALGAAGLLREVRPGTIDAAATAFSWPVKPVCSWVF